MALDLLLDLPGEGTADVPAEVGETSDAGPRPFGASCIADDECAGGHCVEHALGEGRICTEACVAGTCLADAAWVCASGGPATDELCVPTGHGPCAPLTGWVRPCAIGSCAGTSVCRGNGLWSACDAGWFVDDVCCEPACDGLCERCVLSGETGTCQSLPQGEDPDGECGLCRVCDGSGACEDVAAGENPMDNCPAGLTGTCLLDGACDGLGACRFEAAGTNCGVPSCEDGTAWPAPVCDGQGLCLPATPSSCGCLACDGSGCRTSCTTDEDVLPGHFCDPAQACQPLRAAGEPCPSGHHEFVSGFCLEGTCCEESCDDPCRTCATGACLPVAGEDDPPFCPANPGVIDPSFCL